MNITEQQREYSRKWYKRNRCKRMKQIREYRMKNKVKLERAAKKYRKQPRIKKAMVKASIQWRNKHPIKARRNVNRHLRTARGRFSRSKYLAKKKKVSFALTFLEFSNLIQQPCFYCYDLPPVDVTGFWLDRIDNRLGYFNSNVVPCCKRCNVMKNDMSLMEFKKHLLQIVKHLKLL